MVGFIRSLTQFDGFLVEREDLKLKEESSDMTQFVQTPSWKEGKHVQTLSTSMPHHCTYGQLSYTQDNWMGIRKFSRFTYRIFTQFLSKRRWNWKGAVSTSHSPKLVNFILLITCNAATLIQQNTHCCSSDICITISHRTFLKVSIHKGQSSGNQTKTIPHKTKLATLIHSL